MGKCFTCASELKSLFLVAGVPGVFPEGNGYRAAFDQLSFLPNDF